MGNSLLIAVALILIIEGVLPFLNPAALRRSLLRISEMDDRTLRSGGLISMVVGVLLLYWVN